MLRHTLKVVEHLESLLSEPERWLYRWAQQPAIADLQRDPVPSKMAALLHDIGKLAARGQTADGRIHFRGHSLIGYRAAETIFGDQRGGLTRKGRARFFQRCGTMTPAVLLFSLADMAGKRELPNDRFTAFSTFVDDLLEAYFDDFSPKASQPALIDGRDLIEGLGLSPSPEFGRILARIEAERLEGRLKTRAEALERARELAADHRND